MKKDVTMYNYDLRYCTDVQLEHHNSIDLENAEKRMLKTQFFENLQIGYWAQR